ncbi:hypothetical protein NLI96_g803 [Meripilus lineatus]|uniref:WW domain-containing protein n=1 Tax=Meripilus lineatus TaxID=2056292 RepID=A0AAD5YNH9_9APHY|nr:hypothetical protein NLI96_g803 [Physisporinus lineatus]
MCFSPTTPLLTNKYNQIQRVSRSHRDIVIAQHYLDDNKPAYLPPLWEEYVHPEGNRYYCRASQPRFVTDACLHSPKIQSQIQGAVTAFDRLVSDAKVTLTESTEVFLELEDDDCLYYIADHASRTVFWVHPTNTEDLSLRAVVSDSHLRIQLEELYWHHVEFFPCHPAICFSLKLEELTDALIQGRADGLMSTVSTFPYDASECAQFLELIKTVKDCDRVTSIETKWSFARLWTMILNTRFEIHYGEEHCRLSRDQGILELETSQEGAGHLYKVSSFLLWNAPKQYSSSLEKLWVDDIVYGVLWRQFITLCLKEWVIATFMSFLTIIINLLLPSPLMVPIVTLASISTFSGAMLTFKFHQSTLDSASQAAIFMTSACKEKTRFQTISVLFSLPKALLLWTLALSLVRFGAVFLTLDPRVLAICLFVLALVGSGYAVARGTQFLVSRLRSSRRCTPETTLLKV